jgi:membrane peptidoglycan carboxypeptidase
MKPSTKNPSRPPQYEEYAPESHWSPRESPDRAYLGDPLPEVQPAARLSGCVTFFKWATLVLALLAAIAVAVVGGAYIAMAAGLPSTDQLASVKLDQSTKIYDRNGGLLYEIFDPNAVNGGRRTIVPPEQIPLVLKQATIATEDPTFYTNLGVDPYGVLRAIYYDVRYGRIITGGSTITQQVVKNALLSPEQTISRKIREAILAVEVTRRYSKDQILAFYLNSNNYGNLSYGIEAASESYFGKHIQDLDLAEASLLAGLPQAPALYDPCDNQDAALSRQKIVLDLMQKQSYITSDQAAQAASEMTTFLN